MLLRKLSNYSRKNRLYHAFRELGCVVRTVFLLQFLSDEKLREVIQSTTNKMEQFNAFCKWLLFGGEGKISDNMPEDQEKRIRYSMLSVSGIMSLIFKQCLNPLLMIYCLISSFQIILSPCLAQRQVLPGKDENVNGKVLSRLNK